MAALRHQIQGHRDKHQIVLDLKGSLHSEEKKRLANVAASTHAAVKASFIVAEENLSLSSSFSEGAFLKQRMPKVMSTSVAQPETGF